MTFESSPHMFNGIDVGLRFGDCAGHSKVLNGCCESHFWTIVALGMVALSYSKMTLEDWSTLISSNSSTNLYIRVQYSL